MHLPKLHTYSPFVLQQCRPQVEAFLMIVDNQLAAEVRACLSLI